MDNNNSLQQLHREMCGPSCDVRAESIIALALEKGLSFEDFMICCDSLFFREYSKDIFSTELYENAYKEQLLQFHLSRSGIYDQLPEGLFFQPEQARRYMSSAVEMAAEYRVNKQKERNIRRFFQPIEIDFFWQRLQVEREESNMLKGLESGMLNDYFIEFWNLPASIPEPLIIRLILLLPHASKIAGNLSLTAECLELLLNEKVNLQQVPATVTDASQDVSQQLGKQQCGVDMVCGSEFQDDFPLLKFSIGPLRRSRVIDYLEGGTRHSLLQTFYQFFVPVNADTVTNIEVPIEATGMYLKNGFECELGYSSAI